MKLKISSALAALFLAAATVSLTACSDDDLSKNAPDYDPNYKGTATFDQEVDYETDATQKDLEVTFACDMDWTARVYDAADTEGNELTWASVSPESGTAGTDCKVMVHLLENPDHNNTRVVTLEILTEKGNPTTIKIGQDLMPMDPATIPDYDKYYCPGAWNPHFEKGPENLLRGDSYYSWTRSAQSEHFVVFWSIDYGTEHPNSPETPANWRVDIDDLLEKAEHFFDMNVNKLGMSTIGQGKSALDKYKMQIYLIGQDEWLATGSGYDNVIGALWVNPSTCQPVGSTIAHEIGHSFQYMVYADKVYQGVADKDGALLPYGFRYGFGQDGEGGNGFWEQCAQWQAHQDFPEEQFDLGNWPVWNANHHRHFHHPAYRYASYFLQTYWVNKHGIPAYGRIWQESQYPEDAIEAYTRLYCNNNWDQMKDELFDYAQHMATYDMDGVREYAGGHQDMYRTDMYLVDNGYYQVAYSNCPGHTGFNVIPLIAPAAGGTVTVDFEGLPDGAQLAAKDKGQVCDPDGNIQYTTKTYNSTEFGANNQGWMYGFVALSDNDTRTYGQASKDAKGTLSFNVPAGTKELYLVVMGAPTGYQRLPWNHDSANSDHSEGSDPQFPYMVKFTGTDLKYYEEAPECVYDVVDANHMNVTFDLRVPASSGDWALTAIDLGEPQMLQFFGLGSADEMNALFVDVAPGDEVRPAEGTIVLGNLETDGSFCFTGSSNNGYWCDADGNRVAWGGGQVLYTERDGLSMTLGQLAGSFQAGDTPVLRPAVIYTKNGETFIAQYTITYHYY